MREREPVLRIIAVLVLGRGAARLRKFVVGKHLPDAGNVREHAVEHFSAALVLVHAEFEVVAQIATALRDADRESVAHRCAVRGERIGGAFLIGLLIAQETDHVAGRCVADADDLRFGRLVPKLVNLDRRKFRALRRQPDRLLVGELPLLGRHLDALILLARAHREPRLRLVGRRRRITQLDDRAVRRAARGDLELLADAFDDGRAVFLGHREFRREPGARPRSVRVPSRPYDRVAALECEIVAEFLDRLGIVGDGLRDLRGVLQPVDQEFAAAVVDLVEQHAAALLRIRRPQDVDVGLILDHAARVARRFVEIDDALVLGRVRIEFAFGHTADTDVGADLAELMAIDERLGCIEPKLGDGGIRAVCRNE